MSWISLIHSMLPNALGAVSCKATSYPELQGLHVPEPVCEISFSFIVTLFRVFLCVQKQTTKTHQCNGRGTVLVSFFLIWLEYLKIVHCFYYECRQLVNNTSTVRGSPLWLWKKREQKILFLAFTLKLLEFCRHWDGFGLCFWKSRIQITVRRR
jgi:hypothetical protein